MSHQGRVGTRPCFLFHTHNNICTTKNLTPRGGASAHSKSDEQTGVSLLLLSLVTPVRSPVPLLAVAIAWALKPPPAGLQHGGHPRQPHRPRFSRQFFLQMLAELAAWFSTSFLASAPHYRATACGLRANLIGAPDSILRVEDEQLSWSEGLRLEEGNLFWAGAYSGIAKRAL